MIAFIHILPRARPLLRRLLIDASIGVAVNVGCAIMVTYLMRIGDSFLVNLVFSMCIGTLALLFIDGGRLLLWGEGSPPRVPFFGLIALAAPTAYFLGHRIATALLNMPPEHMLMNGPRDTTALLILTILACGFMTWFFWNQNRMQTLAAQAEAEKARAAAIEKQSMQAQLQMLQAQIEPHMLFNTLANLQALITVDAQRAQHMLEQLIRYLRATLSSSRAEHTTLAHEFMLTQAYLELMSVRMGARLSYALRLPDELRQTKVPPMLLQPLVENAIKHGLEPKIDGGRIDVRAVADRDTLSLSVTDTGLGLDTPAPEQSGTGVGLANVRERLLMLYGQRASLSLQPESPVGVTARLTLPL